MPLRSLAAALLLALAAGAGAQMPRQLGVEGRLRNGAGGPLFGDQALTLRLYQQESGGSAVHSEAATLPLDPAGRFAATLGEVVALDPTLFEGPLWLGVEVDGGGELSPRLALRGAPYAMAAAAAASVPTSGVLWVSGAGTPGANGQALLDAIVAAGTPTQDAPVLIRLGPGTFDTGSTSVVLGSYMVLEGAGRGATTLLGAGHTTGTLRVENAADAEVRDLSVEHEGDVSDAVALAASGCDRLTLRRVGVRLLAPGTSSVRGISLNNASNSWSDLLDVHVEVEGAGSTRGIFLEGSGSTYEIARLQLEVRAPAGAANAPSAIAALSVRDLFVRDSDVELSGGQSLRAISSTGSDTVLEEVRVLVHGAGGLAHAVDGSNSSAITIRGGAYRATDTPTTVGLRTSASGGLPPSLEARGAYVEASTVTVEDTAGSDVSLAGVLLQGPAPSVTGTLTCTTVSDGTPASPGINSCP